MAFYETQFPTNIAFNSRGGPQFNTTILALASGAEQRLRNWSNARRRFDVSSGIRTAAEFDTFLHFYIAMEGPLHGFRFKDWSDYKSVVFNGSVTHTDISLTPTANGSNTIWQLAKKYVTGSKSVWRNIVKPVNGTILVAINNTLKTEGADYTIDYATGVVTFTSPPTNGATIKWGGEFDVPCRFDSDVQDALLGSPDHRSIGAIPIVEIHESEAIA